MSLTSSRALSFSKNEVKKSSLSINPGPTQRTSTSAPVNTAQVHMRGKSTLWSGPPSSPIRGGDPPLTEPHTATSHIVTDCEWAVWSLIMNHTGQSHEPQGKKAATVPLLQSGKEKLTFRVDPQMKGAKREDSSSDFVLHNLRHVLKSKRLIK